MDEVNVGKELFDQLVGAGGIGGVLAIAVWYMVKQRDKSDVKKEETYATYYKDALEREKQMSQRITEVENMNRTVLTDVIRENTAAIHSFSEAVRQLPCNPNHAEIHSILNRQP